MGNSNREEYRMSEIRKMIAQLRQIAFERGRGLQSDEDVDAAENALLDAIERFCATPTRNRA